MRSKLSLWRGLLCAAACIYTFAAVSIPPTEAFTARNLAYGSQGYDVDELQHRLRFIGYYWGKIDGNFGWDTYWAVRTFQYNFGLPVTGLVDMKTKMKLTNATSAWHYTGNSANANQQGTSDNPGNHNTQSDSNPDTSSSSLPAITNGLTRSDLNLMAHVVYGEARGEPYKGQVAIAAVILNRLRDPKFPHNIPGIIYQPGAFTCVQDGQVNLQPNHEAMKAVLAAVHGADPSMGATYYFNPATATSPWIWSQPEITQIGNHIFCR